MSETHIVVENLNVHYHGKRMLKEVNVHFPARQVTAVIGPSGCGKTTLLRCLNRMIDLVPGARATGRVLLDGKDIYSRGADVTSIRKRVGLILQRPTPLPMSIFDNVAYGPRLFGAGGKARLRETVRRSLSTAGLWDEVKNRLREPATKLSLGQQQRLSLARGLAVEPEVLLFDEPTSSLDPVSSARIEQEISRLKNDYTCVIVTHDLRQARRLAEHVVFLCSGECVECGAAEQVFLCPKETTTADYIGSGI